MSSSKVLLPKEAGKYITQHSKDVSISDEGVKKAAKIIYDGIKATDPVIHIQRWKMHELNPKNMDKAAVDWIFVCDLLNFSFWSDTPEVSVGNKFMVDYKGTKWTGYWAWVACLNRALEEGVPLTTPAFYSKIPMESLKHVMRSDNTNYEMPMMEERLQCLHDAGQALVKDFDGSYVNVVKKANGSALKLLELSVNLFPSLKDTAEFEGKTVALYKRAQILVADIWACFEGQGYGEFNDIDEITMFADYRIPQALVWFDVLQYSDRLMDILKSKKLMQNGDREEVEIRGCTIEAVERIVEKTRKLMQAEGDDNVSVINAILVDHYLWDYRRENAANTDHIPIHRVRCVYY